VRIHPLNAEERKVELAQIASGEVVTAEADSAKAAKDFAESLLQQASQIRWATTEQQTSNGGDREAIDSKQSKTTAKTTAKTPTKTTRKPAKIK
jgi:TusA-related sulfurtransferase